jgi:hypothetical protein
MAEDEKKKLTVHEVFRKASEILHSIRPQPAAILIADILAELKAKLAAPPEAEPAPKDLEAAVGKIDELVGKLETPPKVKPDFKAVLEAAHAPPPPPVEAVDAPATPGGAPAHDAPHPPHADAKNKKAS